MSNQTFNSVKYVSRSQEFYNDFFGSKDAEFFKQRIRDVKMFGGTDPATKKRFSKTIKSFCCTVYNAPNKTVFKLGLSDFFKDETFSAVNMDWVVDMDKHYQNYCFMNGNPKFVNGKFTNCSHAICDFVCTELMTMSTSEEKIEFPFQEFLYINLANDFVKVHQAIKVQIFPTSVTEKLDTPFFKMHSNGGVIISCNFLSLEPGVNIFKIDISPSEVFEVTVLQTLSPSLTFAQVSNGCLHLHAINSLDIKGDIATASKNVCIPTYITDLRQAKILNILIKDFKNQTYPIRSKTDRTIEAFLYFLGVIPCTVSPKLAYSDYNSNFDGYYQIICDYLGRSEKNVLSCGDLYKMQRFLTQFGYCQKCGVEFRNIQSKKMIVLECWDNICADCFENLDKVNNIACCPINRDHVKTSCDSTYYYDEKNFVDGKNLFNIETTDLNKFLQDNANDRVFSYTLNYNHGEQDINLVKQLMNHYEEMKFEKLNISWNIVDGFYEEASMRNFSLTCRYVDDTRPLTCLVTKPTFSKVDISRKFLEIFKNENIVGVDMKFVDFTKDSDYGKLYDVNNTRIWSKYWRDYLASDYGVAIMIRAPSISGFAKLIEKVCFVLYLKKKY
jgi:hypothetical protein